MPPLEVIKSTEVVIKEVYVDRSEWRLALRFVVFEKKNPTKTQQYRFDVEAVEA